MDYRRLTNCLFKDYYLIDKLKYVFYKKIKFMSENGLICENIGSLMALLLATLWTKCY